MYDNKTTKKVFAGNVPIGGGSDITIQSMLNVPAHDIKGNVAQALKLQNAGCDILRVSVPDKEAVKTVEALKNVLKIPLVADIHFDWRLAIESVEAGVDKVRINPGNIGDDEHVKAVAKACNIKNIPIRIGVNSGSLEKHILKKYGSPTPQAMVESGLYHISLLEKYDFNNIVLSLKSSDTKRMYDAYVLASEKCPYPLHLGVTEAGTEDTAYASDRYDTVKAMAVNEVKLVEDENNAGLALIVKKDIEADPYYLDNLDLSIRQLVKQDEFDKDIEKFVKTLKTEKSDYAINQFKVKKIKYPEQAQA